MREGKSMMKYEVEEPKGFGPTWVHVIGKNAKQETMTIELIHCENPGGKKALPYLWYKDGFMDRVLETWIGCNTYVDDSEGGCYGGYNVQEKRSNDDKRTVIDFDWMFEDTEKNRKKIIEACIKLFEVATGKSATEKKIDRIMEGAKERNLEVVYEMPDGWRKNRMATDPWGAVSIDNGEKVFIRVDGKLKRNPEYKQMLLID